MQLHLRILKSNSAWTGAGLRDGRGRRREREGQIIQDWVTSAATGDDIWQQMSFSRVPAYLVLEAQLLSGTITPDALSVLVDQAGTDAFFLSIDGARVRVRVYLPWTLCFRR